MEVVVEQNAQRTISNFSEPKLQVFHYPYPFPLEAGDTLPGFQLVYTTWGKFNANRSNVVWVLHALTGHPNVTLWWPELFGPEKIFDPEKHFIICANSLGGSYGSTSALSVNNNTLEPFFHSFPFITNRDIVRAFICLATSLNINSIQTLIGGSLGGQQALEWAIIHPQMVQELIVLATNAKQSPWGIAFNESQRMAIQNDASWNTATPTAGMQGMQVARSIALLSYRGYDSYKLTQTDENQDKLDDYKASGYQKYQGLKLSKRFNAYSYWCYTKAMDSHDVGRRRDKVHKVLQSITARTLVIGIESDILFPISEQIFLAENINDATFFSLKSAFGHDGFLTETNAIQLCLNKFLQ